MFDILIIAFMLVGTLFYGSNLGWMKCLVFWAVFIVGSLLIAMLFDSPGVGVFFRAVVMMWYVGSAITSGSSALR
jgi:hypothetical protein